MSDTHKTKPLQVKYKQGHLDYEEHHDHSKSSCDLAPLDQEIKERRNWGKHRVNRNCYRTWVTDGVNICGCTMCTMQKSRKKANRVRRHHSKKKLHDIERDQELYDEELIDDINPDKWWGF